MLCVKVIWPAVFFTTATEAVSVSWHTWHFIYESWLPSLELPVDMILTISTALFMLMFTFLRGNLGPQASGMFDLLKEQDVYKLSAFITLHKDKLTRWLYHKTKLTGWINSCLHIKLSALTKINSPLLEWQEWNPSGGILLCFGQFQNTQTSDWDQWKVYCSKSVMHTAVPFK